MSHKISIITPSFNQGRYLEQTIESVLSQNYPRLEYFVVDGGSSDNSLSIIKKYAKHLSWYCSEKDNGQSHAINKGLKRSTGDIVNWLNSDDYYQPDALKTVAAAFEDPKITMATFRANVFGMQKRISRGTDIYKGNLAKTMAFSRIDQPETFFRKNAVDKMGLLNESLHFCMDKDWLLRYLLLFGQEGVLQSEDIILNFRYHDSSKSVTRQSGFSIESDLIYLHYAKNIGYNAGSEVMEYLLEGKEQKPDPQIQTADHKRTDQEIIEMLNYYLFKRYMEHYELLDFKKCSIIYSKIDLRLLDRQDKLMIEKWDWRARHIPKSFIKSLRVFRR